MGEDNLIIYPASAVDIGGKAVLIEGPSGSGKSELCLMLCDRGALLISDDQTELRIANGALLASPAPNIAGKIEIRNLGILDIEHSENIPVALVITLSKEARRFIESANEKTLAGIAIPNVALTPHAAALPIKAEWALRTYGLSM